MNLARFPARRCFTATGFCLYNHKILLVKHQKLKIWLAPGGHLDVNELPHQAAVREVFEETGLKVKAVSASPLLPTSASQNLPLPFSLNLHWISPANYRLRLASPDPHRPHRTSTWPLGCEQHLSFNYLVKPLGSVRLRPNPTETDAIAWFKPQQLTSLDTLPDIRQELRRVFQSGHHL
ncbi:hypothetical protein A2W24_01280 [Microgenomates group bacterium RBG_16_45_19]|nr:MAG: hypothetical protein A2W24_01280 [Microgenomates group bacterium RBG_16_45_19]